MYFWSFSCLILIIEAGLCFEFFDGSFPNLDTDLCFSDEKQNNVDVESLLFGKSPKSFIYELAAFNELDHKYEFVEEQGPQHEKEFIVNLKLGDEEYLGRGPKIKKAEQDAATNAIKQTRYQHPQINKQTSEISSKDLLHKIITKHGLSAEYESVNENQYCYSKRTNYNCYSHAQTCPTQSVALDDITVSPANAKTVKLIIDNKVYTGSGTTEELAQQNAAHEAFQDLKHMLFELKSTSRKSSFVSSVYKKGQRLKINVAFNELGSVNSGPFKTECRFGNIYSTVGTGTSRQKSKQAAAEEMLKLLDSGGFLNSWVFKNKKKRKKKKILRNFTSQKESTINFNSKPNVYNELQKALRYLYRFELVEPEYEFKKKVTFNGNTIFITKITVKEHEFVANGTSKQESKFQATLGLLEKLGYRSAINQRSEKQQKQDNGLNRLHIAGKELKPGLILVSSNDVPFLQQKNNDLHKFKTLLLRKPDGSLKYITNSELLLAHLEHKLNFTVKYFEREHKINNDIQFSVSVRVSLPNFRNVPANLIYCENLSDLSLKHSREMVSSRAITKLIELGLIDINVDNLPTGNKVKIDFDAIRTNGIRYS